MRVLWNLGRMPNAPLELLQEKERCVGCGLQDEMCFGKVKGLLLQMTSGPCATRRALFFAPRSEGFFINP
jgi:hypothetical protein